MIEKRILIISNDCPPINSIIVKKWKEIVELNVSDFDILIMDMTGIESTIVTDNKIIEIFTNKINPEKIKNILIYGGDVLAITIPKSGFKYQYRIDGDSPQFKSGILDQCWWSPISIYIDINESGSNIIYQEDNDPLRKYVEKMKKWEYIIRTRPNTCVKKIFALTRYQEIISGEFCFHPNQGSIIVLPILENYSSYEMIREILKLKYKIELESKQPIWMNTITIPGEKEKIEEIKKINEMIVNLEKDKKNKKTEKEDITRFKKLLYETNTELENIVWDTLEILNGKVERPVPNSNKEDGWVTDSFGIKYILEIKGIEKSVKTDHVRQLADWETRANSEGKIGIGLLIANTYRNNPMDQRLDPFPSDVLEFIKMPLRRILVMISSLRMPEISSG